MSIEFMLSYLTWDPDRVCFTFPFLDFPVAWYGVFFAFGFFVSYALVIKMLSHQFYLNISLEEKRQINSFFDKGAFIVIFSTVVGARLGYIFFYGWPHYVAHPMAIFHVREGGLASHGGVVGLLLSLWIVSLWLGKKVKGAHFLLFLDALVVAGGFAAAMIRIGNFFNQEITGVPTTLPWGVHFLHPMDGVGGVVHPVQLYEALFYLALFGTLWFLWKARSKKLGEGFLSGVAFLLFFSFRFFIEFLKVPQGEVAAASWPLKMGQLLSIPFFFVGLFFLIRYYRSHAFSQSSL